MPTDSVTTYRYRLTGMHPGQADVAGSDARFRVLCAGRRWGKTRLAVGLGTYEAMRGNRVWWVAPSYKLASVGWRSLRIMASKIEGSQVRLGDRSITMPGGGWLQVRTAMGVGGLRGEGLDFVIYDECAQGAEESWSAELRPALADRKGRALFISTPRGRANWFYGLFQHGMSGADGWQSWHFPTASNPYIDEDEIAAARELLPADVFDQEFLAEFNDAGSSPFEADDIRAMADGWTGLHDASLGGLYLTAWDIGRKADATVGITIDYATEPYQIVAFERMERVPYPEQQTAIAKRHVAFPGRTVVEDNGPGDPVVGNLPVKVESFTTGARNKVNAIQALRLLLERRALKADIPTLTGEMMEYQWADAGLRQDCVMALAIAALHLPRPRTLAVEPPPVGPSNRTSMGAWRAIEL